MKTYTNLYRSAFLALVLLWAIPYAASAQDLPPIRLNYASILLSNDGKVLYFYGKEKRYEITSLGQVSQHVIDALIATEDRDFWEHDGVSIKGLGRAILNTLTGSTQGGSTITMQLARNLFLTMDQTISRKLNEIQIARELEHKYSKKEILRLYLNTVLFGNNAYGIYAASQEYYSKTPDRLSVPEAAMLVGLLKSPNGYEPRKHPEKALSRRNEVMYNLVETGKLSNAQYKKLRAQGLGLNLRELIAPHFGEYVRRITADTLKSMGLNLNTDQLVIYSTLDVTAQTAAMDAMKQQYNVLPASMKDVQMGMVAIEPGTGFIRAMIGGNEESDRMGWNYSTQNKRQPGSSFKPFLYGSILEQGYTLATPLMDRPIVVDSGMAWEWRPMNDDGKSSGGPVPMKYAIQEALKLAAAYAVTHYTNPQRVIDMARRCGVWSNLPTTPSIALGTGAVSPMEMAGAIAVFPAYGWYAQPRGVLKIEDQRKRTLVRYAPAPRQVIDSATCFLLTDALQGVVANGTASVVKRFFKGAAAGKTGTTQNSTDAWFVGYTPKLAAAVWFGYGTNNKKLEGVYSYGGTVAAPFFGRMMGELARRRPSMNTDFFVRPRNVIDAELCLTNGFTVKPGCPQSAVYPMATIALPFYLDRPLPKLWSEL